MLHVQRLRAAVFPARRSCRTCCGQDRGSACPSLPARALPRWQDQVRTSLLAMPWPPHTARQEDEEEGRTSSTACSDQGFGTRGFHRSPAPPLARGRCRRWQRWHWHTLQRAAHHHASPRGTRQRWAAGAGSCRSLSALTACQRLPDPLPLLLPGLTHRRVWGNGLQPPPATTPCCDQTSLTFLLRLPALAEQFLTAAFPSQQLFLLHFSCS